MPPEKKLGILKKYPDGYVMPTGRYSQIKPKTILPYQLLSKDLVGYVRVNGYWILYRDGDEYFRSFFAKNSLWFAALTSELEFIVIGKLPQVYVI